MQDEQWEYKTVLESGSLSEDELNHLGSESWRLVSFVSHSWADWENGPVTKTGLLYVFIRRIRVLEPSQAGKRL